MNGPIKQTLGKPIQRPSEKLGWPDGWYLYENGEIRGPLTASQTFSLSVESPEGTPRLVSRKGFAQWHTLKDLADLYAQSTLAVPEPPPAALEMTRSQAPKVLKGSPPSSQSPSMARPVSGFEAISQADPLLLESDRDFAFGSGLLEPSDVQTPAKRAKSGRTSPARQAQIEVLQNYLASRNPLRLGELRQAWIAGLLGWPLTLGTYWLVWFRGLAREIREHRTPSQDTNSQGAPESSESAPQSSSAPESISSPLSPKGDMPPLWLAAVPLVHMYMTYRLALILKGMEEENQYAKTIPWLAALLSLLPPLAMIYLQSQANTHWLLHVRHTMIKKKSGR